MSEKLKLQLEKSFSYARSGEQVQAEFLEVTAPSNRVINHVSTLDKELHRAMFNLASKTKESEKQDEGKEITGSDLLIALSGGDANLKKCYDALENILILTCCVDGSERFTSSMFKKMDYSETKKLLGEYLRFFLGSSLSS